MVAVLSMWEAGNDTKWWRSERDPMADLQAMMTYDEKSTLPSKEPRLVVELGVVNKDADYAKTLV